MLKICYTNKLKKKKNNQMNEQSINSSKLSLEEIPSHLLQHISFFLDFKSINNLKNVCPLITPIMLNELLKKDIKICDITKLINKQINPINLIISQGIKLHRIYSYHKINNFINTKTNLLIKDVNCFFADKFVNECYPIKHYETFYNVRTNGTLIITKSNEMNLIDNYAIPILIILIYFDIIEQKTFVIDTLVTDRFNLLPLSQIKNKIKMKFMTTQKDFKNENILIWNRSGELLRDSFYYEQFDSPLFEMVFGIKPTDKILKNKQIIKSKTKFDNEFEPWYCDYESYYKFIVNKSFEYIKRGHNYSNNKQHEYACNYFEKALKI